MTAHAGDILRGGAPAGARGNEPTAFGPNPAATAQARNNAKDTLARTTQAVQSVQAMQAAARAAAITGPNHLGSDPNHPGQVLPVVPNGLTLGGLQVAPGVPVNLANVQLGENAALWTGAQLPVQTAANGRTIVTVKQTTAQAVLNWKTLNVGKQTTLKFDQSAGGDSKSKWIAFNKINDPSGSPTQILGSIEGEGQAYVLNQNGILFGGSSQVNLHALTASSLPINDNLIQRGLLNNPDAQFLFSSLALPAGRNGTPAFTPPAPLTPNGQPGDVVVQKGAQITAPTTAAKVGGRVTLVGPNVRNEGTISTPDGQAILAAGLQVGFAAHPSSEPSLRGLDTYVGAVSDPNVANPRAAGSVVNTGHIGAPRANVTMAGKSVQQLSVIDSSTTTALNGRVDLLATYGATTNENFDVLDSSKGPIFLNRATGTVELGSDSVIRILPELTSTDRAVGTQLALASQVNLEGQAIHLAGHAQILAPNAKVTARAGHWVTTGTTTTLAYTGGQIYFDAGAAINVAGSTDVSAPLTENILTLQLRGAELANSPVQRSGALRGPTITIDARQSGVYNGFAWVGTPLGDVSGYTGIIQRSVGELTTAGGTVTLTAGEAVIMQPGSKIDVSGGWLNYEGGLVQTTRVLSGGVIYDLAKATPDRVYDGIYTGTTTFANAKYGITETFAHPLALLGAHYEQGYLHGANAGSIAITAPSMALDGTLLGQAVQGPRQASTTTIALASPGSLSLTFQAAELSDPYLPHSPTPPRIVFAPENSLPAAKAFALTADGKPEELRGERKSDLILSPGLLTESGFGTLTIDNSDGGIIVPQDVALTAPLRGAMTFKVANLEIDGTVTAPGGSLSFSAFNVSPFALPTLQRDLVTPAPDPSRGIFSLGAAAALSTAGLITDYRAGAPGAIDVPPLIDGGSIAINAFTANLAEGSILDVSGGVSISTTGKRSYGAGGSIAINAGREPNADLNWLLGGKLQLGATLKGYSGGKGGSLTVQAPLIQIGGTLPGLVAGGASAAPVYLIDGTPVDRDELLYLTPEFFRRGGFGSFTLNGLGKAINAETNQFLTAVTIAPGTVIHPVAESWLAVPGADSLALQPFLKPEALRTPVSLTFGALGARDAFATHNVLRGDFVMGAGAVIATDPKASVTVRGDTVAVLGSIIAPGGGITISGAGIYPSFVPSDPEYKAALVTVDLGASSVLSTAGRVLLTPDAYGRRVGSVLPGGTITVSGNIVAEAGAVLDVSGTSGILDLSPDSLVQQIPVADALNGHRIVPVGSGINRPLFSVHTVPVRVESDAGSIALRGAQELFTDATLRGAAGGPSAKGGSLAISSGRFFDRDAAESVTPLDVTLIVQQSGSTIPAGFYPAIGKQVPVASGNAALGRGHFAADRFLEGGFDALQLSGVGGGGAGAVQFSGPVSINARRSLSVSDGGVIFADAEVALQAPYVALGTAFQAPLLPAQTSSLSFAGADGAFYFPPAFGAGTLTVRATLIDIGNLSLQNIGRATFIAEHGDIRGNGTLNVAGAIELRAGQIYPTTASRFTIAAYDYQSGGTTLPGSVTIAGSGERSLPLSAGGMLNIFASQITQGGTLRAPLGTINLGWDGTGTSPVDYLTGAGLQSGKTVPVTQHLALASGSVTSVSAVDPRTGQGLILPYGFSANGTSWIDPTGLDITASGVPGKTVNLSAVHLSDQAGSLIDVRGGGDLYAYRWVTGTGGTRDILASTSSFAILPDYEANYAPYAPFNPTTDALNLAASEPGYVNAGLSVGDRVYLGASHGLPAGTYTLLPARYALLPGGVLVTPQTGAALGTFVQPEGASIVSGYRFNDLPAGQLRPAQAARFEIAPGAVVRARAQYDDFLANSFLKESALALGTTLPRLPIDSGRVAFSGLNSLQLQGAIAGRAVSGGHDAQVDISTLADIRITGAGGSGPVGTVVLDAAVLSSFGAESLLIGGTRQTTSSGTAITVKTGNIEVDNAGTPLTGPEIILVAQSELTLAPGATIVQSGSTRGSNAGAAGTLRIGDASIAGSGNGTLLRISDTQVPLIRAGISSLAEQAALAHPPVLKVGAEARISGAALTLDSTYGTSLDPAARLLGQDLALNSGQVILQFENPGAVPAIAGLTLSGSALQGLQAAESLSLLSYTSIDLYGTGGFSTGGALALQAGEIRGFHTDGGAVTFAAPEIILGNAVGGSGLGAVDAPSGTLVFDTGTLRLAAGQVRLEQFAGVEIRATTGVLAAGNGGLSTQGALQVTAPVVTAAQAVNYSIAATGNLSVVAPASPAAGGLSGGLGATLSLTGASVAVNSDILLPSGTINLRATAGDLVVGDLHAARVEATGTAQAFNDLIRYTDGGRVTLTADEGSVTLGALSTVSVAAQPGGGDAGSLAISAAQGTFALNGTLDGRAGQGGSGGTFALDVSSLPDVTPVDGILNAASFDRARSIRVRTGDVVLDGVARVRNYQLSADQGSITISGQGVIDASGVTGGSIELMAFGNVTLQAGARLTVAAADFNSAGKGGAISLEAGSQRNGVVGFGAVDLQAGSTIDLSVASKISIDPATDASTPGTSAYFGQFSGTLHLRAPQNAAGTDLLVNPLNGTILGASSILVEGYRLFDLTNTTGVITNAGTVNAAGGLMTAGSNIQGSINANGQNFLGTAGTTTAGYAAMLNRLLGADPQGLGTILVLAPGAEIIHRTGNVTLGATNSTTTSDWNLATFRYGAKRAPGVLTIRAAGNLVFFNALSDGFSPTLPNTNATWLYTAQLSPQNALLPINTQAWSYRLSAGADLAAASYQATRPLAELGATSGSLQLGKLVTTNNGNPVSTGGVNAVTSTALAQRYQVIRTGSGDITISAGRDVQLLNQFATIYTAGTRTADPTLGGTFQPPPSTSIGQQGALGAVQQNPTYAAQYSLGGGNVTIRAQQDIKHQTQVGGVLVADSERQMPNNWLYRRGYVDPATGEFGITRDGEIGSTTWWVDFSNFFEGVGALGGGHVTLIAGNDVSNVDAVAPTNARVSYQTASGDRLAANQTLVELGGGDVIVRAGRNIDAGIYYVERGRGTLAAGDSIITNSTRSASLGTLAIPATVDPSPAQWLPTTLFLGKGGFDVSAGGDLLLGPVVNPFLLPGGVNNSFWRKSYFSTYASTSEVSVTSLGGSITLRESVTPPGTNDDVSILQNWMQSVHLLVSNPVSVSLLQPWLRLDETSVQPFSTAFTVLPGTLRTTAFSGDINLVGRLNLSPSAVGTVELASAGAINGLQINGLTTQPSTGSTPLTVWGSATINLSDADPAAIPSVRSPYAYQVIAGTEAGNARVTTPDFLFFIDRLLAETGSSDGAAAIIQTQQALHGSTLLHAGDSEPVRLYAGTGDISGLTLFSGKAARIVAGRDITDVAFYLQNTDAEDVSVVSAGRDVIAYNANSLLRAAAQAPENLLAFGEVPLAGDLQISGPGTLEVLAGRHLDLGTGANLADGTGVGLTSIGNARNPNLPFAGADIIAAAGLGPANGLADSTLDFDAFLSEVLAGAEGERYLAEVKKSNSSIAADLNVAALEALDPELRAKLALEIFYLVLRDAGRDHNVEGQPGFGNYDAGFAAIAALFAGEGTPGDITTRSRDIRTKSGGSISLLAPGGGLTLAKSNIGTPLAPPGIITEAGGSISIFTQGSVDIGIARIFTLRGGNEVIWSSAGDIAAGSSSKTVQSAPPTRVLIDPQSADLKVDLAGLATGGGIGVLATVGGVPPGSVDLIAPEGTVDAGDAGIRATGDLNIAAVTVLNADNIQVAGATIGTPTPPQVAAPNIGALTQPNPTTPQNPGGPFGTDKPGERTSPPEEMPSIITVEVLGYGGGEGTDEEEE